MFFLCNFVGLLVISETSISRNYGAILRNFYKVVSQNFAIIRVISKTSISQNYGDNVIY